MKQLAVLTLGCALIQLVVVRDVVAKGAPYLCDCFLTKLQNLKLTWQAGRNFNEDTSEAEMKKLYGSSRTLMNARSIISTDEPLPIFGKSDDTSLIPDSFDAREQWPFCNQTISNIKDTGFCASHWAFAVTQALTDRICIHSGGKKKKVQLSPLHLLACCKTCGSGCLGGYPFQAWKFIEANAIVTGGDYKSHKGCKPYPIPSPCNYVTRPFCKRWLDKPPQFSCTNMYKCTNKKVKNAQNYTIELVRNIPNSDEFTQAWTADFIKQEILSNGPVTATMRLYSDFFSYKSGIYSPSKMGVKLDDITLRIIGWGKEGNLQYWLGAAVWGPAFGDNGFVKIRMGTSALQIDRRMHSGVPQL